MMLWGLQSTSIGALTPHQACEFGIIAPILMVRKTAQGSDMAKVTQPEGGKVGSIQPQLPGLQSVPMLRVPQVPSLFSHNKAGEGWQQMGEMDNLFSFRGAG